MPTLTITHRELSRLVEVAAPCAGTDELLPVFTQIRLEEVGGKLFASATDRYVIVRVRTERAAPKGLAFGLHVRDWKHLLRTFKPQRALGGDLVLRLSVTDAAVTVKSTEGTLATGASVRATYLTTEGQWPQLGHLFNGLNEADTWTAPTTALVPDLLRKMPRGRRDDAAVLITRGPGKPAYALGEDWAMAIMSYRCPDGEVDARIASWAPPEQPRQPDDEGEAAA